MKKLLSLLVISMISFSGCSWFGMGTSVSEEIQERFSAGIDCDDVTDPYSHWCAVTHIGDFAMVFPEDVQTYLGLSMALPDGDTVTSSIVASAHVSALHIGPDTARLTALVGTTDQDTEDLSNITNFLTSVLQGMGGQLTMPEGLTTYLESERAFTGYAMNDDSNDVCAYYDAPLPYTVHYITDQVYGDAYIVIEDAVGGVYVSIFPAVNVMQG